MKNKTFNWQIGVAIVRILAGLMILHHGLVIFSNADMTKTIDFFSSALKLPAPAFLAWLAKGAEFFGGCLLILGLFTKPVLVALIIDMTVAVLVAGKGNIFTHAELPFVYLLLFALLAYIPADEYSIITRFFKHSKNITK